MNVWRDPWVPRFRWLQWGSAFAGILVAVLLLAEHRRHRSELAEQIRSRNALKLVSARDHIEDYFGEIHLCLRLFGLNPAVQQMSDAPKAYLRSVFEANHTQHSLSEVYVLKRDFDGTHRPFMTFELGDEHNDVETIHSAEREAEEYAAQMDHIRQFAVDPSIEFLVTEPIPLCVGEPGMVLSVPVRVAGELIGAVSGMVRSSVVSSVLERSSLDNLLVLTNARGDQFGCDDIDAALRRWFVDRFQQETGKAFSEDRERVFKADRYTGLWLGAEIADDQQWYISLLYDEAAALNAPALSRAFVTWGASVAAVFLGVGVVVLCNVILALRSARHESEDRLRAFVESEARTRAIVDTAVDGIITINEEGVIESANRAAVRLFGHEVDELVGKNISLLMPLPFREHHSSYIKRYMTDRIPRVIGVGREAPGLRKDGSTVPLEVAVSEVRLHDRTLFAGVLRDVSERKRAEDALRESEERFRAIAQYTYDWENWVGPDGKILWINPGVERITGYSVDECLKMPGYPWPLVHEDDRNIVTDWFETAVESRTSGNDLAFRIRQKNGGQRWVAVSWQPIFASDGTCLGHRSSVRDITERKRAEAEALQRQTELAHVTRLSTMGEMATELAHELNQPLASVVNYVEACAERIRTGSVVRAELLEHLNSASSQARRASQIVDRIRVFVRKRELQKQRADVNRLVRSAADLVRCGVPAKGVKMRFDLTEPLPSVAVESIQIEQVVVNLIRNGLDAMKGCTCASPELVVQTLLNDQDHIVLNVCDRGPGLSSEDVKRAFEPFFTTKVNGMGMGLPISRSIIEGHGGELRALRNPEGGSTFQVILPVEDGGD